MQQYRPQRVAITERGRNVLRQLIDQHGVVLFHQTGADSVPRCLPVRDFTVGGADVLLGYLPWHTEFWMSADQYEVWKHTHLTVDAVTDPPEDTHFVLRSRLLTDDEVAVLPPPRTGADRMT